MKKGRDGGRAWESFEEIKKVRSANKRRVRDPMAEIARLISSSLLSQH